MANRENKYAARRLRSSYASTIVGIALVLFMLGLIGIIILYAQKLSDYVKENIQMSVIIKDHAKEADIIQLQKMLDISDYVKSTEYVTKEEAAKRLQEDLGEDFISVLGHNPLLPSIDVRLHAVYANADSIHWIEKKINESKLVREIFYQKSLVNVVNENVKTISLVILAFSGLLLIIAIALINNTIRLSLYSKRFLIKSMQLVGATRHFIRKPFLVKGIVNGLYAAILACILLLGVLYIAQKEAPELFEIQDYEIFAKLFMVVVVGGIFISCISTFFAINKYLRLKIDDLYY